MNQGDLIQLEDEKDTTALVIDVMLYSYDEIPMIKILTKGKIMWTTMFNRKEIK